MYRTLAVALALLAFAPGTPPEPGQAAVDSKMFPLTIAPAEWQPLIRRADDVFARMSASLQTELTAAMRLNGPAGAIDHCHMATAAVVEQVKRQHGIPVGRTSDRLRNPTNVPPAWAAATVKTHAGARAAEIDGFAVDLGDRVGVLRPIAQGRICAGCHGPASGLEPRVRAVLKERYPADHAVGFAEGEIRGWFWAEVPKSAPPVAR